MTVGPESISEGLVTLAGSLRAFLPAWAGNAMSADIGFQHSVGVNGGRATEECRAKVKKSWWWVSWARAE